jgi:hypothetical protein
MLVNDDSTIRQGETHILHPSSRMLFRFWEGSRAEKAAPRREDLDLKQVRQLVPHLFIAEYDSHTRAFRWRLAGTGICQLYGRELTGGNMLAGWDHFEADTIGRFLAGTVRHLQPCLMRFRYHTDRGQVVGAELAGFPLTASDGRSTHILGGLFPFRETATLDHVGFTHYELAAARSIWTALLPSDTPQVPVDVPVVRHFQVIPGGRA